MNPDQPTNIPVTEAKSNTEAHVSNDSPKKPGFHLPKLKKHHFGLGILILIVLVAGLLLFNKHRTHPAVATTGGNVSITPTGFFPQEIHIKKNQTITWTNNDASKAHQVKADPYPTGDSLPNLDSGPLNNTDSYTYTYEKTGTYTYHDQQDPYKLQGKVVVE